MSMKMGASRAMGDFELCPSGPQQLVCCDIIDHGLVATKQWGTAAMKDVPKVTIRWQSAAQMKDGRPYIVQKRYTLSSHPKSTLRKDLEAWRGKPFTDQEADDFDLEKLISVNCFANVVHEPKTRGVFAEVRSIMPRPQALPKIAVRDYVRVKDRVPDGAQAPATSAGQPPATSPTVPVSLPPADDFPADDPPEPGAFDGPDEAADDNPEFP